VLIGSRNGTWRVSDWSILSLKIYQFVNLVQPGVMPEKIAVKQKLRVNMHNNNKKHLKNVGPIRHNEPPHANSPGLATVLSHAACASMSTMTTTTTTTTTTTRDRGDRYGPMEWAQSLQLFLLINAY